jgi:hypothetical protein
MGNGCHLTQPRSDGTTARTKPAYFIQWEINMCAYRSTLNRCIQVLACAGFITLSPLSHAATDKDPWERINRPIFSFNDTLDTYALKPLAQGYQWVTPFGTGRHSSFLQQPGGCRESGEQFAASQVSPCRGRYESAFT